MIPSSSITVVTAAKRPTWTETKMMDTMKLYTRSTSELKATLWMMRCTESWSCHFNLVSDLQPSSILSIAKKTSGQRVQRIELCSQLCHIAYGDSDNTYDVRNLDDLLRFYVFIEKTQRRAETELVKLLKDNRASLLKKIAKLQEGMEIWTARAQLLEYGLIDKSSTPNSIQVKKVTCDQARMNASQYYDRLSHKGSVKTHIKEDRNLQA